MITMFANILLKVLILTFFLSLVHSAPSKNIETTLTNIIPRAEMSIIYVPARKCKMLYEARDSQGRCRRRFFKHWYNIH